MDRIYCLIGFTDFCKSGGVLLLLRDKLKTEDKPHRKIGLGEVYKIEESGCGESSGEIGEVKST